MGTYRATSQLILLAVMSFVVSCLPVAYHGHDIGEYCPWPGVLVGIEEYTQPLEAVCRAEHGPGCGTLLGEPHSHAICMQVTCSMDFELHLDLRFEGQLKLSA